MSSTAYVIGYCDSPACKRAMEFAITEAKQTGAEVVVASIIEWSPYAFLTPQQLEERHKLNKQETAEATKRLESIVAAAQAQGVTCSAEIRHGHIAESILKIAEEKNAGQIVIGRTTGSALSTRIFGSVPTALVQASEVPVTVVP